MRRDLPDPILSRREIAEVSRQFREYKRVHRRRPGAEFDRSIFMLYMLERKLKWLWPGRKRIFTKAILSTLEAQTGLRFNHSEGSYKKQIERLKESRLVSGSGVLYMKKWGPLILACRVYDTIKKEGEISARELQRRFSISQEELEGLIFPNRIIVRIRKPKTYYYPPVYEKEFPPEANAGRHAGKLTGFLTSLNGKARENPRMPGTVFSGKSGFTGRARTL